MCQRDQIIRRYNDNLLSTNPFMSHTNEVHLPVDITRLHKPHDEHQHNYKNDKPSEVDEELEWILLKANTDFYIN